MGVDFGEHGRILARGAVKDTENVAGFGFNSQRKMGKRVGGDLVRTETTVGLAGDAWVWGGRRWPAFMVAGEKEKTQSSETEKVLGGGSREGGGRKASCLITKVTLPFCSSYFQPFNNKHR